MGGADKVLLPLGGTPLVVLAAAPFLRHPEVERVVVVVSDANRAAVADALGEHDKLAFAAGGERRRDSVLAGLRVLGGCDYAVVHDGARPLASQALIDAALTGAREHGAALCAVPVTDTVKRANETGLVRGTVSREGLWLAQTPQAFRLDVLLRAHREVEGDLTDDAAMVEHLGLPVKLVPGSRRNLKVTTPEDLALAEALLAAETP
jgi:2-C-methyl-D-erythritol 4-phosphate cytidylyltransferase